MEKQQSPFAVLWHWAAAYHGGFYGAVALAVLGVACHMLAYVCIAVMIRLLLSGGGLRECLPWCGVLLAGYGGKALFSAMSTSASHTATYYTLRDLRKSLLSKLSRVPMGTILDTPSGQYKTTIVDRVEGMEPTLAHLIPEMTANALVPLFLAVYIFVLDWRMGLASLVTTVIGLITASQSGKTYAVRWQGAVEVGAAYGQRHRGIHRRHPNRQGVQPVCRVLSEVFQGCGGQRAILCGLDGGQPKVYVRDPSTDSVRTDCGAAGRPVAVERRKSRCRDFPDDYCTLP